MNNQEFFTAAVTHLRRQGRKSINEAGCLYTAPQPSGPPLHCAVGGVMSDELRQKVTDSNYDGTSFSVLREAMPEVREFFGGVSPALVCEVQVTHDCYEPDEWEDRLQRVADAFHIEMPPGQGG